MTSGGVVVCVYLNVFLLIGLVLRNFFKRISALIPYTVLLLGIGAGLGFAARALEEEDGLNGGSSGASGSSSAAGSASGSGGEKPWWSPREDFMYAIATLGGMDPHLLLYIFLPALLFESANAIDFHVFKKVVGKTVTLAFPMMLLGTLMMASVVRLVYPSWSWDLALLLGTITSATDPVAVVAMLRELGAKVSLSTTIEGESLMNDGSAVVLFNVLKTIAQAGGTVGDIGGIIGDFFRMAVLGPVIGWGFGVVALFWISRVFNDPLVEISISIVTAYLAYYISEYWIHSSGVLTVVFTGLAFSSTFGRTSISPEVFHFLHEFWETLGYVANTIIFLITGVAIAYNSAELGVTGEDVAISFLIYFSGIVIRMVIFTITYPLFTRMTYGWTWQEALIASWGGLRGAVGLALGLDIFLTSTPELVCPAGSDPGPGADASAEPNIACKGVQGRILLHTSMMVVCTLVINASTLKPLLAVLKFVELSHEELTMLAHVAERLKTEAKKEMSRIQNDPFLSNSNWEIVRQYADLTTLFQPLLKNHNPPKKGKGEGVDGEGSRPGSPTRRSEEGSIPFGRNSRIEGDAHLEVPQLLNRESLELGRHSRHSTSLDHGGRLSLEEREETDLLSELKYHYHMSLKAGIWHLQHQGTLGSSATDILADALNHKLDDKHTVDWIEWKELQAAGGQAGGFSLPPWMSKMRGMPVVGQLFDVLLGERLQMWHDIAFGFLTVHEHLEHEVEHWTHDEKLLTTLHDVLHKNAEGARKSLIDLQEVLPEVCLTVNTKQAARLMLNATREKIQSMEGQGALPEPQAKAMVAQVETQMRKLQLARMPLDFSKEKVLREVSWMQDLQPDCFRLLVHASKELHFSKGEYVVKQGDVPVGETESVFLVARGIVEIVEEYENGEYAVVARRGSGVVIGEQSLLTGSPRAASARACTSVLMLGLSHAAMQEAMTKYPELSNRMWQQVGLNMAQKLLGDAEESSKGERTSSTEELKEAASQWVPNMEAVMSLEGGATMPVDRKVLLLHGSCIEFREGEAPPSASQLEELQLSMRREAVEAHVKEQDSLRHVKREKTKGRRLSLHAAFFGAGDTRQSTNNPLGGGSSAEGKTQLFSQPAAARTAKDDAIAQMAASAAVAMGQAVPGGAPGPAAEAAQQGTRTRTGRQVGLPPDAPPKNGAGSSDAAKVAKLKDERRIIHQTSPWIIHIAPCLIDAPTGGAQAKHQLQFLSPTSRLCVEPDSMRDSSPQTGASGTQGEKLDGAPLQLISTPHELKPSLRASMLNRMTTVRYQPGDVLTDGRTGRNVVHFLLSGQVRCDVDPAPILELNSAKASEVLKAEVGVCAAGEPFAKGNEPFLFSPPAGSPIGEWLLLQPKLVQMPRVVAHTPVTCVTLTEDVLLGAMQAEEMVATNFWWARCQRETFCFLRKLEPFCWWQPSKLWRWLQYGRHVKVPEGKGVLGASAPFVVLVQGRCHVSYNEAAGAEGPQREVTGSRAGNTADGKRQPLGQMRLLGSGATIAGLLPWGPGGHHSKELNPYSDSPEDGKWVAGPDVVHCHDEIAYHFARDSLVFIPSKTCLDWLPANYVFGTPAIPVNGGLPTPPISPFGRVATATGSPAYSFDKRSCSPVVVSGELDTLAA